MIVKHPLLAVLIPLLAWPLSALAVLSSDGNTITDPSGVPGQTLTILNETGTVVAEGELDENRQIRLCASEDGQQDDEDGVPCLAFNQPAGEYTVETGGETAVVNWTGSSIASIGAAGTMASTSADKGLQVGVGLGLGMVSSDFLDPRFVQDGMDVGATGDFDVDDDATAYSLQLDFFYPLERGALIGNFSIFDAESFNASFNGTIPGVPGTAMNQGSFDLSGYGIDFGYENFIDVNELWTWQAGVSITRFKLEDSGSARVSQGGVVVFEQFFSGSETDTALGLFGGVARKITDNVSLAARLRLSNNVFNGEPVTQTFIVVTTTLPHWK